MHDPKFEKEVQQKLQELSFSPSEAVWTHVERAVNGKKRRRMPVFWLFVFPALMLTGAGAVYLFTRTGTAHKDTSIVKAAVVPVPANMGTAPKMATSKAVAPEPAAPKMAGPEAAAVTSGEVSSRVPVLHHASRAHDATAVTVTTDETAFAATTATEKGSTDANDNLSDDNNASDNISAGKESLASGQANLPKLNVFDRQFSAPAAARPTFRSHTASAAKATIQLKPRYSWEAGFAGGIGVSSLNKTLFEQPSALATDVRQVPAPTTINGSPKSYTSKIRPDLSYWAGIVAQRPLSSRLTLALGLNLHYYSMKIQIGEKVVSPPGASYNYSTQSLFNAPLTPQIAAYPYYSVGDKNTYTNRYYFVELPASILWQVNHSRSLPLFWEGGFSLAYLVSSNALYYNSKSAVFYKDGGMTNKAQLNAATALLVGLPIRGIRLQAGPQIQYGITSLQNNGAGGQHLFYGGLRVVLLPGKARK